MKRYINLTENQRYALETIYRHNTEPFVKVSEYKQHHIKTRSLNCIIKKGLIEIIYYKDEKYYYRTERGRVVSCTNYNHNIDTTLGDYLKTVEKYNVTVESMV